MTLREKIIGSVAIVALAMLVVREGCNQREKDRMAHDIATYSDTVEQYETREGVLISTNQSLRVENKEQLLAVTEKYGDTLRRMIKKFRAVSSVTVIKGDVQIKHDTIELLVDIPCNFDPIRVRRDSAHYTFLGTIGRDFFSIDSLSIPIGIGIVVGERRMGFLRKPEHRVELVPDNPLVHITNVGSFVVRTPKKWYQRPVVGFGIGLVGGAYLVNKLKK